MRNKLITTFLTLFLLVSSISFANSKITNQQDPEKDKVLISVLNYMLTRGHYIEKELNDDFSEIVFKRSVGHIDKMPIFFVVVIGSPLIFFCKNNGSTFHFKIAYALNKPPVIFNFLN